MNPMQALANRTARLAREASTPVYTTTTPVPQHRYVAEMEHPVWGGRQWSKAMTEDALEVWIDEMVALGYEVSDHDHAGNCWCEFGNRR